jgi:hypothetical protein
MTHVVTLAQKSNSGKPVIGTSDKLKTWPLCNVPVSGDASRSNEGDSPKSRLSSWIFATTLGTACFFIQPLCLTLKLQAFAGPVKGGYRRLS